MIGYTRTSDRVHKDQWERYLCGGTQGLVGAVSLWVHHFTQTAMEKKLLSKTSYEINVNVFDMKQALSNGDSI